MNTIRILDQNLINQIAAGEVIERPAAAIKELIENSLDANAKTIEITLREGGRSFIEVKDDGWGMTKEDLCLSVERHATSKLRHGNLFDIHSFGFRGEALPSIGSVGRLTIRTRLKDNEMGWKLSVEGGIKKEPEPIITPIGTTVILKDLFFATPARLRFLKSTPTETLHCLDLIKRLALAHYSVSFVLKNNNKITFSSESVQKHEERIGVIFNEDFMKNSSPVFFDQNNIKISGRISHPTFHKSQGNEQFLYVNNRPIRDKFLNTLVRLSYKDLTPHGRFPLYVLFIELPPADVDVNVHPAKAEVRFKNPQELRSSILSALGSSLRESGQKSAIHLSEKALNIVSPTLDPMPLVSEVSLKSDNYFVRQRPQRFTETQERFFSKPESYSRFSNSSSTCATAKAPDPLPMNQEDTIFLGQACGQIDKTYILAEKPDGFIIVDQHAAHERLVYEKMKTEWFSGSLREQLLVVPEVLKLEEWELALLKQYEENLKKLAIRLEYFGGSSLVIRSVPALLKNISLKQLIKDLIADLKEIESPETFENYLLEIFATLSCHSSIRAGRKLSIEEMNALLRLMEKTQNCGQCNHGRPTYIEFKKHDLDKLFSRT